jgi:hypothetical protein
VLAQLIVDDGDNDYDDNDDNDDNNGDNDYDDNDGSNGSVEFIGNLSSNPDTDLEFIRRDFRSCNVRLRNKIKIN